MKKIMGVIGYPIKHSLSPQMHSAVYDKLKLSMAYHAFEVRPDQLEIAIQGVRGLGLQGVNVTIPHKVEVMNYLDEIDGLAKEIGAVNTIVNVNGRLKGYNTDGEGYLRSLLAAMKEELSSKSVLMIGAGGASKAVSLTLAKHGVKQIVIANRTLAKAQELQSSCSRFAASSAMTIEEAEQRLDEFDIIINTTSIGMLPEIDAIPISLQRLKKGAFVSDLIYTPVQTKFLREAEEMGAPTLNGVDMFVYQGALAFEHWTNIEAPIDTMRNVVLKHLKGEK
ncbi:shikimate dehydrogenase [Evansella sp. AB-rgal1]|uniref:shikimate dehydrogenase n=1 Tax=Evansella sp. AB-rgal1 TaxID=3242696 RepID=UPI00359EB827